MSMGIGSIIERKYLGIVETTSKSWNTMTSEYDCPLLNKVICDGECYDIQMIRMRCIKMDILDCEFNREEADRLCNICQFNQLQ